MKNFIKKTTAYAVLPAMFSGYIGLNSVRASEGAPEKIDINHSEVVFSYEQPSLFMIGRKRLECGKTYLIEKNSVIDRPTVVLDKLFDYLEDQRKFYHTTDGTYKIDKAEGQLIKLIDGESGEANPLEANVRKGGREVNLAGLNIFRNVAADGIITPDEYMKLRNGDAYVSQIVDNGVKVGSGGKIYSVAHGRLDQGVIVRVDHSKDNCYQPMIVTEVLPQAPAEESQPTVQQPVAQPTPQPEQPSNLEKSIETYQPSQPIQPVPVKKESFRKRHPVWTGLIIGAGVAAAGYLALPRHEEKTDNVVCTPTGCITGGDEY